MKTFHEWTEEQPLDEGIRDRARTYGRNMALGAGLVAGGMGLNSYLNKEKPAANVPTSNKVDLNINVKQDPSATRTLIVHDHPLDNDVYSKEPEPDVTQQPNDFGPYESPHEKDSLEDKKYRLWRAKVQAHLDKIKQHTRNSQ